MSGGVPAGVKLSPCPFCGSEAEFFGYQGATKAKCSNENCEAETGPWFADIDCNSFGAAAKKWNTRATPTPPPSRDADVERVEIREYLIACADECDLQGTRYAQAGAVGAVPKLREEAKAYRNAARMVDEQAHGSYRSAALQALGERG